MLVRTSIVHLYKWCKKPWLDPQKWCRDFSVAQHISPGAVSVRGSCPLYYDLFENHIGFLKGCYQWCWKPFIWEWCLPGIFLQLIEVKCHGNCCSLSCLLCSCRWSWLMHLWGLAIVLQPPTTLWTVDACIMSVCCHHTGISWWQCHQSLVLCWVLALWWLWWLHPVWGHPAQTEWIENALCLVPPQWWFLVFSAACGNVPAFFSSALTSLWGGMCHPFSGVVMCFALMDHTQPWLLDRNFLSHYGQQKIVTPWSCFPTTGLSLLWAASARLILHS